MPTGPLEIILPRRVIPQPLPQIVAGGDCGACVLSGLLGLPIAEIYTRYCKHVPPQGFSWEEIHSAIWRAKAEGLVDRFVDEIPIWPNRPPGHLTWGWPSWTMNLAWHRYVWMALEAGYYGLTGVDLGRRGPYFDQAGQRFHVAPDHFIMIVGARERWEAHDPNNPQSGQAMIPEILISCSSTQTPDLEWVEVRDFLRDRGGYNVILARPKP